MDTMLSKALRKFMTGPLKQLIVNLGGNESKLWEEELKKFLRKEHCWTNGQVTQPFSSDLDPTIHVDRSIRPTYPDWVKIVMHPDLESTGPVEFDAGKLEQ